MIDLSLHSLVENAVAECLPTPTAAPPPDPGRDVHHPRDHGTMPHPPQPHGRGGILPSFFVALSSSNGMQTRDRRFGPPVRSDDLDSADPSADSVAKKRPAFVKHQGP